MQRIQPERVLQVGEQEFLVLLFMVQSQLDQRATASAARSSTRHPLIDRLPIGIHLGHGGAGQQAPGRPAASGRRLLRSRS